MLFRTGLLALVAMAPALITGYNLGADKGWEWCNHGTQGNHGCEDNSLFTYCCGLEQTWEFSVPRWVTVNSATTLSPEQGGYVTSNCNDGSSVGIISCALAHAPPGAPKPPKKRRISPPSGHS
ncbi:hypothetical protein E4U42_001010 [Claviceps africana]|uniref:Hydrophobin n=1 Tax=Claviceps africana TaxID=83212 RepID=A0A8K0IZT9_9HYPO|nr:hypothetical protein E4U42_001010 [Claviceps africana]